MHFCLIFIFIIVVFKNNSVRHFFIFDDLSSVILASASRDAPFKIALFPFQGRASPRKLSRLLVPFFFPCGIQQFVPTTNHSRISPSTSPKNDERAPRSGRGQEEGGGRKRELRGLEESEGKKVRKRRLALEITWKLFPFSPDNSSLFSCFSFYFALSTVANERATSRLLSSTFRVQPLPNENESGSRMPTR